MRKRDLPPCVYLLPNGKYQLRKSRRIKGKSIPRKMKLPSTATEGEIYEGLAELSRRLDQLEDQAHATSDPTQTHVREYLVCWFEQRVRRFKAGDLAEATVEEDQFVANELLIPQIGHLTPAEVTPFVCRDLWLTVGERRKRNGEHYADESLATYARKMRLIIGTMAEDFKLGANPAAKCTMVRRGIVNVREARTVDVDGLYRISRWVHQHVPRRFGEYYWHMLGGFRSGELRALHDADIDRDRMVARVWRGLDRGQLRNWTKTKRARDVSITSDMLEVYDEHRALLVRTGTGISPIAFPNESGGFRGKDSLRKLLNRAAQECDVDVRVGPQVLRKTLNSRLIEQGVPEGVIRSQMGHVTTQMTRHYTEVHAEPKRAAIINFEAAVRTLGAYPGSTEDDLPAKAGGESQ